MGTDNNKGMSSDAGDPPSNAEERRRELPANPELPRTHEETLRLVHELEVHRIKLEIQNEQLRQTRDDLEKALEKYSDLYDFAPVGYFTIDRDGSIRSVNLSGADLLGIERSRLIGRQLGLLITNEDRLLFAEFIKGIFANQNKRSCDVSLTREGNTSIFVHIEAAFVSDGQECRITLSDITDRKRIEESLIESENRYHQLFEMESDTVLMVDWERVRILEANSAATRMYGFSREELLKLTASDLSNEPDETEKSIRNEEALVSMRWHRKKDGTVFPVEINGSYYVYQGRKVHVTVIRDITERVQAEQHLIDLNQRLRALSGHLQSVQEQERLAISRDMHDDVGQILTALKLDLTWLEQNIVPYENDIPPRLNEMHKNVDQITAVVQRIAANLRPPLLDNQGLSAAIEWHAGEFSKRSGIECFVMINEDTDSIDKETATAIMRILQEGLTNIARHARASEVGISLCTRDESLILEITDNGCGITQEQIASLDAYGLMGMQERAKLRNGKLEIKGEQGCGTILLLTIPLESGGQNI